MSLILTLASLAIAQEPPADPTPDPPVETTQPADAPPAEAPEDPPPPPIDLPPGSPQPGELLEPRELPSDPPAEAPEDEPSDPPPPPGLDIGLPQFGERTSNDIPIFLRADGQAYHDDQLVSDSELDTLFEKNADNPGTRIILTADTDATHGRLVQVLDMIKANGIGNVAIAVSVAGGARPDDPLFPGGDASSLDTADVTKLQTISKSDLHDFKPKHGQFPQNPYDNVDYTAYTLEPGEAKIGIGGMKVGVAPRLQLGTQPLGDLVRFYNLHAKWNAFRERKMDLAFRGNIVYAPVGKLLGVLVGDDFQVSSTEDDPETEEDESANTTTVKAEDIVKSAHYIDIGIQGSRQLLDGWSIHGTLSYAAMGARGKFSVSEDLPFIPVQANIGDSINFDLSPRANVSALQVRFATDYRFNRRDSFVLATGFTAYAKAQLATKASNFDLGQGQGNGQNLKGVDVALGYGGWELLADPLRTTTVLFAYERSMRHWEVRGGLGWAAMLESSKQLPAGGGFLWSLASFDASYRFGGKTRRLEQKIRQGYQDNQKDLRRGGDQVPSEGDAP